MLREKSDGIGTFMDMGCIIMWFCMAMPANAGLTGAEAAETAAETAGMNELFLYVIGMDDEGNEAVEVLR
jgi:hypothetical protein